MDAFEDKLRRALTRVSREELQNFKTRERTLKLIQSAIDDAGDLWDLEAEEDKLEVYAQLCTERFRARHTGDLWSALASLSDRVADLDE